MAGNRGGHGAVPFVHLRLLLRGPVFPPLPSTQVNAPSPRLLSWHPALPGANGVSAVVGGTCCETWWDFPLGCLMLGRGRRLGSGCCREHPLVGAGHRDLLFTGLYLLITGGEMGDGKSSVDFPKTDVHLLGLAGGRSQMGDTKNLKHQLLFFLF